MGKSKIIIGVLAVLVLGGIVYFSSNNTPHKIVNEIAKLNPDKGIMCTQTVNVGEAGNSVTSTIYILGNKMRYDSFLAMEDHGQKDLHMISDGEYSYLWGKGMAANALGGGKENQGFKMKNDSEEMENNSLAPDIDIDELKKEDYKAPGLDCQEWKEDPSVFELPKEINFVSMEEMLNPMMMKNIPNEQEGIKGIPNTDPCGMCEMIPDGQAKQECKKSCQQ